MHARSLLVLPVVACLLAGCGNADAKTKAAVTVPPAPTTTTTAAPTNTPEADKARAQRIVLTSLDVPSGFTEEKPAQQSKDDEQDPGLKEFESCVGAPNDEGAYTYSWDGAEFGDGKNSIQSSVTFTKTAADSRKDFDVIKTAKFRECLRKLFVKLVEPELAGVANVKTSIVVHPQINGADIAASRMVATVTVRGQSTSMYLDQIGIISGRAQILTNYVYVGTPPPLTDQKAHVDKLRQRAEAAQRNDVVAVGQPT